MRTALLAMVIAIASPVASVAHDLWLLPPASSIAGQTVKIRAVSGTEFPLGEEAPDTAKFLARRVFSPTGAESTAEPAGADGPAGLLTFAPNRSGDWTVAVETTPRIIELKADAFNHYLISDGLPHIYLQRYKSKTLNMDARERYSKSPKCLLRVGSGSGDTTKPLGLTLEIVPLKDPFAIKTGEALPVKVLFRKRPLADACLGWAFPGDGEWPRGTTRTNAQGEALIPVAKTGLMTIRLTHMTHPKNDDYEWESFWTTLTWHAPGRAVNSR